MFDAYGTYSFNWGYYLESLRLPCTWGTNRQPVSKPSSSGKADFVLCRDDGGCRLMAVGALAGFGALLVTTFGVRTVIHRRRTGETGWRAPPNGAAWVGDGLFTVGVLAAIAGPALDLADVVEPVTALDWFPVQVVGIALLCGGGGIAAVAQAQMGESWRAGIDVNGQYELVRGGLFRVVRNPFYLGIILAVTGVVLMLPTIVTALGWIAVVLGCEIDVRLVEEPHLSKALGPPYREYAAATGRFIPGLGRVTIRCQ